MSATAELRSATWEFHQRLEKRLEIKSRFTHPDAYRSHLEKMWGFCAAIERGLGQDIFGGSLADYEKRRKVPLLARDLISLGVSVDAVRRLPLCDDVPGCGDRAAAFGCVYVLEGASLGGRTLLPLVESRLGLSAVHGAAFLASYGENVESMWAGFRSSLDAWCDAPERRAHAAQSAVATFASLDRWLCGSSP